MSSEEEALAKIKEQFEAWDSDGDGEISYEELKTVMAAIMPDKDESDIKLLMKEIDKNGDGVIQFDEFVAWIADPSSSKSVDEDGKMHDFDFQALLKPLFAVFDKDSGGTISKEEFVECSGLLVNSMKMHPRASESDSWFSSDFSSIDENGDGEIDFDEFFQWQRRVLKDCGIPKSSLPSVMENITSALKEIMEIDEAVQKGMDPSKVNKALQDSVHKLANSGRQLYVKSADAGSEQGGVWLDPPTGFSLQLLARKCASELGVSLGGLSTEQPAKSAARRASLRRAQTVTSFGKIQICFPDVSAASADGEHSSRWFARVRRDGKDGSAENFLYCFDAASGKLDWESLEDSSKFETALHALKKEIRCLALLKTQALMSKAVSWDGTTSALKDAVAMTLMSQEDADKYSQQVLDMILQMMEENDEMGDLEDDEAVEECAKEHLDELQMSPLQILYSLMDLGAIPVNKWAVEQFEKEMGAA